MKTIRERENEGCIEKHLSFACSSPQPLILQRAIFSHDVAVRHNLHYGAYLVASAVCRCMVSIALRAPLRQTLHSQAIHKPHADTVGHRMCSARTQQYTSKYVADEAITEYHASSTEAENSPSKLCWVSVCIVLAHIICRSAIQ